MRAPISNLLKFDKSSGRYCALYIRKPTVQSLRHAHLSLFVSPFALCGPPLFFRVPQVSPPASRAACFVTLCSLSAHPPSGAAAAVTCQAAALALQAPPTPQLDAPLVVKSADRVAKSDDVAAPSADAVAKSAEVRASRHTS